MVLPAIAGKIKHPQGFHPRPQKWMHATSVTTTTFTWLFALSAVTASHPQRWKAIYNGCMGWRVTLCAQPSKKPGQITPPPDDRAPIPNIHFCSTMGMISNKLKPAILCIFFNVMKNLRHTYYSTKKDASFDAKITWFAKKNCFCLLTVTFKTSREYSHSLIDLTKSMIDSSWNC